MTVKTTLSFTDRHHQFLKDKVGEGVYASASAAVAAAVERMIEDEQARETALEAMADEIRRRAATPRETFVDHDTVFAAALRGLDSTD
ncbi:type II toxin-antitoxin system ParD family antitoxin [Ruegeria sp. Ofav3-42]|uniref:type II toxin-antitoxin system ParD family antitoxin n=1 Tax=Ruegeria sp. Ofav3-42 TaxID=2917759 RepID=UPI001EF3E380|nr:type II toxin-antitoxin system ParD family antitoxin [Ruegeria sp. Ofav3-42]MCG7521809.1 type II toxin-antitoxin system ParD family antitoxin [Ruegeria sp. Ofav3-42]